jgi:hypothetical protein
MSTYYAPTKKIPFSDLFDGRLEMQNVREELVPGHTTVSSRCLTDGRNFIWADASSDGFLDTLVRRGRNAPRAILSAIEDVFETEIVSEHDARYWGYETQEEWDAVQNEMAEKHQREFEGELLKYLRGEPCGITPGTIGYIQAQVAQRLVAENPDLMLPGSISRLMAALKAESESHHVTVILSPEQKALAEMWVTHESELPEA